MTPPPSPSSPNKERGKELEDMVAISGQALFERVQARRMGVHVLSSHVYTPYGAAAEAYNDTSLEILMSGPAGTGKSRAALEKVNAAMWQYPGARALIVRKTRASLTETGLVTFEQHVLGENSPVLMGVGGRIIQRGNRTAYHYPNGSVVVIGGLDKPTRILSSEYDLIFVQEAIELFIEDWESLLTRLRNGVMPYQQLIADTNPDAETHWLYRRCSDGVTKMIRCTHEDNPRLYVGGAWTAEGMRYLGTLDRLTGVRYDRMRWGKWVSAEGAVYEDFSPAVHIIDRFPIPPEWRRIRSIDFGYNNPFSCSWWAIDGDGNMYLYRQIYHTRRLVEDHARQINALTGKERIEATVADHDAEDRATLERYGIQTIAAEKAILPGIQAVQARLRVQENGKPRIFLLRDSLVERDPDLEAAKLPLWTGDEAPSYTWEKAMTGKPNKERPVDRDNHGLDEMRYAVMYMDGGAKSEGRVIKVRIK